MADQHKTRNRVLNILKVVISLGVLGAILANQDMEHVLHLLREMDWLPFLAALSLMLGGSLVRAYRWGALVWALGVDVSWWRLVGLYFVGAFFGLFLPTGVGGDAVKMYELSRDDHKASAAISSVLIDRFLGLFVLFAMALIGLAGGYRLVEPRVRIFIGAVFVVGLVGVGLVAQRTWIETWGHRLGIGHLLGRIEILRDLYASLHQYGPAALSKAVAASVLWNLMLIVGYYLLAVAVGIQLSLWHFFLFVPVISALLAIPLSLGGLGIREASTTFLFVQAGTSEPKAVALALAYDITMIVTALIGAGIYIIQGIRDTRK